MLEAMHALFNCEWPDLLRLERPLVVRLSLQQQFSGMICPNCITVGTIIEDGGSRALTNSCCLASSLFDK